MAEMNVPTLRSPVVLVHGLLGFDRLTLARRPVLEYFPGIADHLRAGRNRVYSARLSPTAGVGRRAAELRDFILARVPNEPVHVIAHSMGGLDARYMVSRLGMERNVLSLTTVGTPHRGSPIADWGVRCLDRLVRPVFRLFGWCCDAFYDLTTMACAAFNATVPDSPRVRYFSVAGRCEGSWLGPGWRFPWGIVRKTEGENDGVVSVASASYGESTEIWAGDHLNLVNWPNMQARCRGLWRDRAHDYGRLVRRLADEGF
jgi:triacylglycerol lipase